MKYTKIKLCELIEKSEGKEILLPNFQREFVWDRKEQQSELLASLIFDIPIGSLLILSGEKNYFSTKELCKNTSCSEEANDSVMYLLDGQQRISTLKSVFFDFFSDVSSWKDVYYSLQNRLRTRWFININPRDGIDLFGYKKLKFGGARSINSYSPSDIKKFISYEIIYPNKKELWFHPEFKLEEWYKNGVIKENTRIKIVSEEAAKELRVPLYGIANCSANRSSTIQYKTLKKIAMNRMEELKTQVDDNILKIEDILTDYCEDTMDESWEELVTDWVNDVDSFINNLKDREIPVIELLKEEMNRAIYTFENVNKGGVSLSTYDLIVAKAAHDRELMSLTTRIQNQINENIIIPRSVLKNSGEDVIYWNPADMGLMKENEISEIIKNQYLNMLSIFSNFDGNFDDENKIKLEWIKKNEQLSLTSTQINDNTRLTITSIIRACAFLQFRCGIVKIDNVKFQLMLLPIAYVLKDDKNWNDEKVIDRIEYWYWTSLFSGTYRQLQNSRAVEDIKLLYKFINGDISIFEERKSKIFSLEEYSDFKTLAGKNKEVSIPTAVYHGILQYILSKSPRDFINDEIYLNAWDIASGKQYYFSSIKRSKRIVIQDHHICPLGSVTRMGESAKKLRNESKNHMLNSPLNRTYISSEANSMISDKSPLEYFDYVSNLSMYKHCIPTPIKDYYARKTQENENEFFERILKNRYNEIKRSLELELDELINR